MGACASVNARSEPPSSHQVAEVMARLPRPVTTPQAGSAAGKEERAARFFGDGEEDERAVIGTNSASSGGNALEPVSETAARREDERAEKAAAEASPAGRRRSIAPPTPLERDASVRERIAKSHPRKGNLLDAEVSRLSAYDWEEALVKEMLGSLARVGGTRPIALDPRDVQRFAAKFAAAHMQGGVNPTNVARVTRRSQQVNKTLAELGLRYYRVVVHTDRVGSMNGTLLRQLVQSTAEDMGPAAISRRGGAHASRSDGEDGDSVGGSSGGAGGSSVSAMDDSSVASTADDESDDGLGDLDSDAEDGGVEVVDDLDDAFGM